MADQTPVDESTPPSDETEQPSESEPTDTVESLKEKLAAEAEERQKAEEEAKRWKNRVKEENPPKKKSESDEDYADWRIDNRDRISLVKEQYEKELEELQESGAKVSLSMREKALRLAESSVGVKKQERQEPIPSGGVDRSGSKEPQLTEHDRQFDVNPDIKKKYSHLEKEWQG